MSTREYNFIIKIRGFPFKYYKLYCSCPKRQISEIKKINHFSGSIEKFLIINSFELCGTV